MYRKCDDSSDRYEKLLEVDSDVFRVCSTKRAKVAPGMTHSRASPSIEEGDTSPIYCEETIHSPSPSSLQKVSSGGSRKSSKLPVPQQPLLRQAVSNTRSRRVKVHNNYAEMDEGIPMHQFLENVDFDGDSPSDGMMTDAIDGGGLEVDHYSVQGDALKLNAEGRTRRASSIGLHNTSIAAMPLLMMKNVKGHQRHGGTSTTTGGHHHVAEEGEDIIPSSRKRRKVEVRKEEEEEEEEERGGVMSVKGGMTTPRVGGGEEVENLEGLNLLWYSCVDTHESFLDSHAGEEGGEVNFIDDNDPLSQSMIVPSPTHSVEWDNDRFSNGGAPSAASGGWSIRKRRSSSI